MMLKRFVCTRVAATAAVGGLALTMVACQRTAGAEPPATAAAPSSPVKTAPDDSFAVITGTVVQTAADSFTLDYGEGQILVEMDDWDWYPEAHALLRNDDVTVYGYIDDGFYEQRKFEASSVYVSNLGTQFYANGADEEDFASVPLMTRQPSIYLKGRVASVSEHQFQLDTGDNMVRVDTDAMPYDPLDDEGFQRIAKGERVLVVGNLDYDLFTANDLVADTVVSIEESEDSTGS